MSRGKLAAIIVVAILILVIGWRVLHGRAQSGPTDAGAPVPVTVVPAGTEDVPVYLTANGTVQALNTVTVQPQVGGQLLKLDFVEGGPVKKGQVLAEIDPRSFQAQYEQQIAKQTQDEAQLGTAQANLNRSEDPKYKQYVAEIDRVTQANTVRQLSAAVAADAAAIRDSQVQLGYTRVLSPIDGLAGIRQVDPGNVVTTSTDIVTLTQLQPINVIFTLPGKNLDEVRAAQAQAPLQVAVLDAADNHVIAGDGSLAVIDNQIDPNSASFKLKAVFPNSHGELWPGEFANVRLRVKIAHAALVVPTAAVQRGPDGEYVYLVVDGDRSAQNADAQPAQASSGDHRGFGHRDSNGAQQDQSNAGKPVQSVKMQPVTVAGEADDTHLMIASGLKPGDLVVTEGQFRLKPGSRVLALKPGEVPPPPSAADIKKAAQQGGGRGRHE